MGFVRKLAKTFAGAKRKDIEKYIDVFYKLAEERKYTTITSFLLDATSAALRMKNREEAARRRKKSKRT